jgi:hypothetical protein
MSTATHSDVDGHETAFSATGVHAAADGHATGAETSAGVQVGEGAVGLVEISAVPVWSTPTHNDVDGQDTEVNPIGSVNGGWLTTCGDPQENSPARAGLGAVANTTTDAITAIAIATSPPRTERPHQGMAAPGTPTTSISPTIRPQF